MLENRPRRSPDGTGIFTDRALFDARNFQTARVLAVNLHPNLRHQLGAHIGGERTINHDRFEINNRTGRQAGLGQFKGGLRDLSINQRGERGPVLRLHPKIGDRAAFLCQHGFQQMD